MSEIKWLAPRKGSTTGVRAESAVETHQEVVVDATSATYVGMDPMQWGWRELRDYVVARQTRLHGSIERKDPAVEAGIFKGFLGRHERAVEIAVYVMEVCDGTWGRSMVGVGAFTKAADDWFANPILSRIS